MRVATILLILLTCSSCVTEKLWRATDPEKYVRISKADISEDELKARGVFYHRDDENGVYYVEKSNLRRLGDYSIRFFAAPITVAIDAVPPLLVIGAIAAPHVLEGLSNAGKLP